MGFKKKKKIPLYLKYTYDTVSDKTKKIISTPSTFMKILKKLRVLKNYLFLNFIWDYKNLRN